MFFGNFPDNDQQGVENKMDDTPDDHPEGMATRFPHHYLHMHHHRHHPHHHQHYQQQKQECVSDEVDSSRSSGGGGKTKRPRPTSSGEGKDSKHEALVVFGGKGGEEATVEVAKRPRGRPLGSKNKPKPPVVITRETAPASAMRPHILEIPGGHDVVDSLARFCRRRNLGICVLAGTGAVANVALRQPSIVGAEDGANHLRPPPPGAQPVAIGFHGRFEILSMSATFLPPAMDALSPAASGTLSISLAGPQGQIVGGTVAGPLMTAGTVVVVAAAFSNPTFHRLSAEDDVSVSVSVGDGADAEEREQHAYHHHQEQQQQPRHHGASAVTLPAESCAMQIYSCHLPTEVIWAPPARPPPPPY